MNLSRSYSDMNKINTAIKKNNKNEILQSIKQFYYNFLIQSTIDRAQKDPNEDNPKIKLETDRTHYFYDKSNTAITYTLIRISFLDFLLDLLLAKNVSNSFTVINLDTLEVEMLYDKTKLTNQQIETN